MTHRIPVLRSLLQGILLLGLGACTATSERHTDNSDVRDGVAAVLQSLQQYLPGNYNNHVQTRSDPAGPHLRLHIEAMPEPGRFQVTQTDLSARLPARSYVWQFGATDNGRLMMQFAPLIDGQTGRACSLELLPSGADISGSTTAAGCPLPNDEDLPLGLQKEYLLAPGKIDIGERLINLDDQQAMGNDTRLSFRRELIYSGWAGRKNADDAEWLLAKPFTLHNQGDVVTLYDQLDRDMGYRVELAQLSYRQDQPEILRLVLIDTLTNEQVAFAFADRNAAQIGLHLGWLQIGMQRDDSTRGPAK